MNHEADSDTELLHLVSITSGRTSDVQTALQKDSPLRNSYTYKFLFTFILEKQSLAVVPLYQLPLPGCCLASILLSFLFLHKMHDSQLSFSAGYKDIESSEAKWKKTLGKVASGVVSVKFCHTASFDASYAGSSEATGFVVDAKNGYVFYYDTSTAETHF